MDYLFDLCLYLVIFTTLFTAFSVLYYIIDFLLYVRYRNRGGKMSLKKWMDRI